MSCERAETSSTPTTPRLGRSTRATRFAETIRQGTGTVEEHPESSIAVRTALPCTDWGRRLGRGEGSMARKPHG